MNKYFLLGKKLDHSISKYLHMYLYKINNINAEYTHIEVDEISQSFIDSIKINYQGFNVTIPYKEKIIDFLDYKDELVLKTNSCNTVLIKEGKLYGYNTDYFGFIDSLKYFNINLNNKNVFILGSGATSKTINFIISNISNAKIFNVSRKGLINYNNIYNYNIDVIINTTPICMYPNKYESLIDKEKMYYNKNIKVIDLIYNPLKTKILFDFNSSCNGLVMLFYQAIYAIEIWYNIKLKYDILDFLKKGVDFIEYTR